MRRVSYLKATAGERLPIDSDGDINEHETESVPTVTTPTIPEHAKG